MQLPGYIYLVTIESDLGGHGVPSTHKAPLRCVLGHLFLCSHQTEAIHGA